MNTAIAAVSVRFAAWLPGGSTKAGPSLPQILKFSPSPSTPPFSRGIPFSILVPYEVIRSESNISVGITTGRCGEALAQRVGSGTYNDVLVQRIGDKNVAEAVKNILEMTSRASLRREILQTDFLTPPVLKESIFALEKLTDVKAVAHGGYPQAERCRISIGNTEIFTTEPDVVAALSISGNFEFEHCSHGDFLGSMIGTGIGREKVGDILLQGKRGAQVVVVPELTEFLISALNKVGNVPVSCQQIPLFALEYEPPRSGIFILN